LPSKPYAFEHPDAIDLVLNRRGDGLGSREDELLVVMQQTTENIAREAQDRRIFAQLYETFDMGETINSDRVVEEMASTPDKQVWGDPELCNLYDGLVRGQVTEAIRRASNYDMDYVPFRLMLHYLGNELALAFIGCLGIAQALDLKVRVGAPATHFRRGQDDRYLCMVTLHLTKFFLLSSDPAEIQSEEIETGQTWRSVMRDRSRYDRNHGNYFMHVKYLSESLKVEVGQFPPEVATLVEKSIQRVISKQAHPSVNKRIALPMRNRSSHTARSWGLRLRDIRRDPNSKMVELEPADEFFLWRRPSP